MGDGVGDGDGEGTAEVTDQIVRFMSIAKCRFLEENYIFDKK